MSYSIEHTPPHEGKRRLPAYLRKPQGNPEVLHRMKKILRERGLHTVCESARCPNIGECFSKPTATFMLLGEVCTRSCGFCGVEKKQGRIEKPSPDEPSAIALAVKELGLKHVVVTSVTRDDLRYGGADEFAAVVRAVRESLPDVFIEVLTPDFRGDESALNIVLESAPDIFNHNIETVERLYPAVRPEALYSTSLEVLSKAKKSGVLTKSGLMLGLGEGKEEVKKVLKDLHGACVDCVTIGQYLRPTRANLEVKGYVTPEGFEEYGEYAKDMGIKYVYSGPFVRSSYNAEEVFKIPSL
ncbi:MAG: lipoyl synthase [Deltaproteobacteria bacterium]|nr:lipoyl synthase [Deltaproteobacteria bacterium]